MRLVYGATEWLCVCRRETAHSLLRRKNENAVKWMDFAAPQAAFVMPDIWLSDLTDSERIILTECR